MHGNQLRRRPPTPPLYPRSCPPRAGFLCSRAATTVDHLSRPNPTNPIKESPMSTNRFSHAHRSTASLVARLLPGLVSAGQAALWHAVTSPWRFLTSGGLRRLLRSRKKARHVGYTTLHLVLASQPPEPLPQYIIEVVAKDPASDQESRCYIAPSR